jgi:hypothetical protein
VYVQKWQINTNQSFATNFGSNSAFQLHEHFINNYSIDIFNTIHWNKISKILFEWLKTKLIWCYSFCMLFFNIAQRAISQGIGREILFDAREWETFWIKESIENCKKSASLE